MSRPRIVCVVLALITVLVYWPVRHHEFVNYDDNGYVTQNPHVQAGLTWAGANWAFTTWQQGNWHPLTWLSHMLDCQLFGSNAGAHHLVSVAFHALNAVLLFLLLLRLTGAIWQSALVAALFAWHPLHVESVAWVAERKDVLSAFFGLLTLLMYVRFVEESKVQRPISKVYFTESKVLYGLALMFFALALMAKPMLVTLPFVMLLLDYWPLGRVSGSEFRVSDWRRLALEKWPFFALTAGSCVVTFIAQQRGESVVSLGECPPELRLANAVVACAKYLAKTIWPMHLAVIYPLPSEPEWGQALVASAVLVLISWWAWRARRQHPYVLMGWLWFLGMLVPVIGLVQVGFQAMADRYTYLPLIGVFIGVIFGASGVAAKLQLKPVILTPAACILLAGCLFGTVRQVAFWRNSETLFDRALTVTKGNYIAYNNIGTALLQSGRLDEAIAHFQKALELLPSFAEAHYNLGLALAHKGQVDEAIAQYQEAIGHKHQYPAAYNDLGIALLRKGQLDDAVDDFQQALALEPDDAEAHYNLGTAFLRKGQLSDAIAQFRKVLELFPDDTAAHNSLGKALLQSGQVDEAFSHFQKALKFKPEYADAHYNLGAAFLRTGQLDQAIAQFQKALAIKPDLVAALNDLGVAFLQTGKLDMAIVQFRKALALQAEDANALNNLAVALLQAGQVDEAIVQFQKVLNLRPNDKAAHNNLGKALLQKGQVDNALSQFQKAVEIQPDYAEAHYYLGAAFVLKEQLDDAVSCFEKALKLQTNYAAAAEYLGSILVRQGRVDQAIGCFQKVLEIQPRNVKVLNDLAWILATCPEASLRDGARSVDMAEQADRLSGGKNPAIASTLAAAYAEAGRFPEAVAAAQRALQSLSPQTDAEKLNVLKTRLAGYQTGLPFRDTSLTNGLQPTPAKQAGSASPR